MDDLKPWEVEQLRRSVAMLRSGERAGLDRETALRVLDQLRRLASRAEHEAQAEGQPPPATSDAVRRRPRA
jgi:hypothetical protein